MRLNPAHDRLGFLDETVGHQPARAFRNPTPHDENKESYCGADQEGQTPSEGGVNEFGVEQHDRAACAHGRPDPETSVNEQVGPAAQAFFYNAIFFTYALVLTDFYGIPADQVGWYILPFAAGNVLGPILLGHLFDTLGRRVMIASTYALSGILLAATAELFSHNVLTAQGLTSAWMIVFFFASAAASSAYLTVSEIFPLEIRAFAIAFFYAIGTGVGGVAGPLLLGELIDTGSRSSVSLGYALGAVLMIAAAVGEAIWGVAAERKSLEAVARPLSFVE